MANPGDSIFVELPQPFMAKAGKLHATPSRSSMYAYTVHVKVFQETPLTDTGVRKKAEYIIPLNLCHNGSFKRVAGGAEDEQR
jgi:hypothetical protein